LPPRKKPNPFAKIEAIEDVPLAKILAGEVAVSDSVADALEEREVLRKSVASLTAEQAQNRDALRKLQDTVTRLSAQPAAPKGAVFALGKADDAAYVPGQTTRASEETRIAELAKVNPEAASRELLKIVHSGGGTPLVPPR